MQGFVHSIQSMGMLDGPGVRFVVFAQGCPLRCKCCHNPDTWEFESGQVFEAEELVRRALRYREYFGKDGGVTVSGGEPLMQPAFVKEFFSLCHQAGLHTCMDTSGCVLDDDVRALLAHTDRVLLDIKYATDALYRQNVGCSIDQPLAFLDTLQQMGIATTLRNVIIPTVNDTKESVLFIKHLAQTHSVVDKIELLPFRKICQVKYDNLHIPFPFCHLAEPSKEQMQDLEKLLLD